MTAAAVPAFTPARSAPLEGTVSAQNAVARVSYTHDAMIDLLIANPGISQNELAKHFGYTAAWISRIRNSDAFLARLAERKADIVDPTIIATVEEKFRAVASKSLDIILEKLELPVANFDQALAAATIAGKALGYGARQANVQLQQNFVVALPGKAQSAQDWAAEHSPAPLRTALPFAEAVMAEPSTPAKEKE